MKDCWLEYSPSGGGRDEGQIQVGRDQALPARQLTAQSQELAYAQIKTIGLNIKRQCEEIFINWVDQKIKEKSTY
jgi:hypothetical protein